MERAKVTLRQAQIDRLVKGETVVIRLRETELEIRFDFCARVKMPDSFDDFLDGIGARVRERRRMR